MPEGMGLAGAAPSPEATLEAALAQGGSFGFDSDSGNRFGAPRVLF